MPMACLAARQACGLGCFIYVCWQSLRPARLAASRHLYIFCLRPGIPAAGFDPRKKMGAAAPTNQSILTLTLPAIHSSAMWSGNVMAVVGQSPSSLPIFNSEWFGYIWYLSPLNRS